MMGVPTYLLFELGLLAAAFAKPATDVEQIPPSAADDKENNKVP
jgi:Sec-independent protein secretion pathway component TatC